MHACMYTLRHPAAPNQETPPHNEDQASAQAVLELVFEATYKLCSPYTGHQVAPIVILGRPMGFRHGRVKLGSNQ